MVLEVRSLAPKQLELLEPWHSHSAGTGDDFRTGRVAQPVGKDRIFVKRYLQPDDDAGRRAGPPTTPLRQRSLPVVLAPSRQPVQSWQISPPATPTKTSQKKQQQRQEPAVASASAAPSLAFTQMLSPIDNQFVFSPKPQPSPHCGVKRCRPTNDVDGPNTAELSFKKRRLRLTLVTSRLSLPFSSPATHILSREAAVSGEKRFVKLASYIDPTRRVVNVQSSMLRRVAILNRVRLRVCHEAVERGNKELAGVAANTALLHNSLHHHATGARFIVSQTAPQGVPHWNLPATSARSGAGVRDGVHPVAGHRPNLSPPTTPKLNATDPDVQLPPTPRLKPLCSPTLRPQAPPNSEDDDDVDEDDGVAFPTAAHESRYEASDDPEEVYSDFSLIFGGSADALDEDDEHSFEELLDELDGIPSSVR